MSDPQLPRTWWLGAATWLGIAVLTGAWVLLEPFFTGRPVDVHLAAGIGKSLMMSFPAVLVVTLVSARKARGK